MELRSFGDASMIISDMSDQEYRIAIRSAELVPCAGACPGRKGRSPCQMLFHHRETMSGVIVMTMMNRLGAGHGHGHGDDDYAFYFMFAMYQLVQPEVLDA